LQRLAHGEPSVRGARATRAAEEDSYLEAEHAVEQMRLRGRLDADFFKQLAQDHPGYAARIRKIAALWTSPGTAFEVYLPPAPSHKRGTPATHLLVSYSRSDYLFFEELHSYLVVLQRRGVVDAWTSNDVASISESARYLHDQLTLTPMALLLVSDALLTTE